MLEQLCLGMVQGIAEWLPISSEGMIVFVQRIFFGHTDFKTTIQGALFLHLGSALAAMIYFKNDIISLVRALCAPKRASAAEQTLLSFLVVTTIVSGLLGLALITTIGRFLDTCPYATPISLWLLAAGLALTALFQYYAKNQGHRNAGDLKMPDTLILSAAQGLASLPGISRSGITISCLLFRNLSTDESLRISFLMSVPIVLIGNVAIGLFGFSYDAVHLIGLAASFVTSLVTIHLLMAVARKVNFAPFVGFMALLVALSAVFHAY